MRHFRAIILVIGFVLAGCGGGPKADLAYNPVGFTQPDPAPVKVANSQYRLGALDRFELNVFSAPNLSREYVVEPSGLVQFPLIGDVQVAGLTSTELSSLLTRRYGEEYLRDPDISVNMTEARSQIVTVEGAVRSPINFDVVGETQLLQALARAGGTSASANTRRVVMLRTIDGVPQAAAFDLARIREGLDPNPPVYPGDVVIVDGSELRQNLRDLLTVIPIVGLFRPLYD